METPGPPVNFFHRNRPDCQLQKVAMPWWPVWGALRAPRPENLNLGFSYGFFHMWVFTCTLEILGKSRKVETNQQKVHFKSNKFDLYNPQKIGVAHEETMGIQWSNIEI